MKNALLVALCFAFAPLASAAPLIGVQLPGGESDAVPVLYADVTLLSGNLIGYSIYADDLITSNYSAWFLDGLTFTGNIQQLKVGKNSVNDNLTAEGFDGFGGYDMTRDSYFFKPFTDNLVSTDEVPGIVETLTSYGITAGSGGGSELRKAQIAYIVASGDLQVSGVMARALGTGKAGNFAFNGVFAVPEPGTLSMLAVGSAVLVPVALRMRRRRR
jgi:hypothetical protein